MAKINTTPVCCIGNYYGCLNVCESEGRYYWIIENYDTDLTDISEWRPIPKTLYDEIIKHNATL